MLKVDYLYVLAALLTVGEPEEAKKAAARLLCEDMTDLSDLWTIHQCAAILDNSIKLSTGKARLGNYARQVGDEHRAAIIEFCREHTGSRPRRATVAVPEPKFPLSVFEDTRPGYDENDAQPSGLTVHRAPWLARHDRVTEGLTRQLRVFKKDLPARTRAHMGAVKTTDPTRCRPLKSEDQQAAAYEVDAYVRTRLGKQDRTAHGMRTIFDVDDDNHRFVVAPRVMAAHIARIREQMQACTTATEGIAEATAYGTATDQPATPDTPETPTDRNTEIHDPLYNRDAPIPGYEFDYAKAALHPIRTTPCVVCWTERRPQDARTIAHAQGYDDSLCGQCRSDGHTGLPKPRPMRILPTVAYLNPVERAQATADAARTAAILAPCVNATTHLPKGAALVWLRAYRALTHETDRPTIDRWVLAWLDSAQPQPPAPAPAAAAIPVTVIKTNRRFQYRHGQPLPANTKFIGRPTPFGNPFRCAPTPAARAEAVRRYRQWISTQPDLIEQARAELTGRTLACYCPTDGPCHADVLLEIIDAAAAPSAPAPALAAA